MEQKLFFSLPGDRVFELLMEICTGKGEIKIKNKNAYLIKGEFFEQSENFKAQIRIFSSDAESFLIFYSNKEIGINLFELISKKIRIEENIKLKKDNVPDVEKAVENQEFKNCPFCAEKILFHAKKCRYCGEFLQKLSKIHRPRTFSESKPNFSQERGNAKPTRLEVRSEDKPGDFFSYSFAGIATVIGIIVLFLPNYYTEITSWFDAKNNEDQYELSVPESSKNMRNTISETNKKATSCSICGKAFYHNGYEEVMEGVWEPLEHPYSNRICSRQCGARHTEKMNNLLYGN